MSATGSNHTGPSIAARRAAEYGPALEARGIWKLRTGANAPGGTAYDDQMTLVSARTPLVNAWFKSGARTMRADALRQLVVACGFAEDAMRDDPRWDLIWLTKELAKSPTYREMLERAFEQLDAAEEV